MDRPLEQDVSGLTTLTVDRLSKEGLLARARCFVPNKSPS